MGNIDIDDSGSGSGSSNVIINEEERSFEFLTSAFGGVLPIDNHNHNKNNSTDRSNSNDNDNDKDDDSKRSHSSIDHHRTPGGELSFVVTMAMPHADACSPLAPILPPPAQGTSASTMAQGTRARAVAVAVAVVVQRGVCTFDVKAFHVQQAGGHLMIVVDPKDGPLQRLGGSLPLAGHVGIPR